MPRYFTDRTSLEGGPDDDAETAAHERFQSTNCYDEAFMAWLNGPADDDLLQQAFQRSAAYAAAFDLWWGERG